MIPYLDFYTALTGLSKQASIKVANPLDFSEQDPQAFKKTPDRAILPGTQLRNAIAWLQHNSKAGINKLWDKFTLAGGAPSPAEYQAYKRWRAANINTMPPAHYDNRMTEQDTKESQVGKNSMPKSFYLGR